MALTMRVDLALVVTGRQARVGVRALAESIYGLSPGDLAEPASPDEERRVISTHEATFLACMQRAQGAPRRTLFSTDADPLSVTAQFANPGFTLPARVRLSALAPAAWGAAVALLVPETSADKHSVEDLCSD